MLQLSVDQKVFEDILNAQQKILRKDYSKYLQKELLEPKILNDKISYSIKDIQKLKIVNGLGSLKPQLIIECTSLKYNTKEQCFEFHLGIILEQKNTTSIDLIDEIIKKLLKEKEDMADIMFRDYLTGLYNRYKMKDDLNAYVKRLDSNKLSAVFVDADRFKGINDKFGHDAGDEALKYLSSKLQDYCLLLNAQVYRFGGEEFILLCFKEEEELLKILNRLRIEIKSQKVPNVKESISLTVSMGVAFWKNASSKDDLIKRADLAVYEAKEQGRNKVLVHQT